MQQAELKEEQILGLYSSSGQKLAQFRIVSSVWETFPDAFIETFREAALSGVVAVKRDANQLLSLQPLTLFSCKTKKVHL